MASRPDSLQLFRLSPKATKSVPLARAPFANAINEARGRQALSRQDDRHTPCRWSTSLQNEIRQSDAQEATGLHERYLNLLGGFDPGRRPNSRNGCNHRTAKKCKPQSLAPWKLGPRVGPYSLFYGSGSLIKSFKKGTLFIPRFLLGLGSLGS